MSSKVLAHSRGMISVDAAAPRVGPSAIQHSMLVQELQREAATRGTGEFDRATQTRGDLARVRERLLAVLRARVRMLAAPIEHPGTAFRVVADDGEVVELSHDAVERLVRQLIEEARHRRGAASLK